MFQRAIHQEDKEKRRNAILDAAETLFMSESNPGLRVEAVAHAAGLAKGTVYLYFRSKEEMLLAVHARHVEGFFAALFEASRGGRLDLDGLTALVIEKIVRLPAFLPMAGLCTGLMESGVEPETALAFKRRIAALMDSAGVALQVHFPLRSADQAVALLMHSYALIIGLWQLLQPSRLHQLAGGDEVLSRLDRDYETELVMALRALWAGELGLTEKTS